MVGMGTPRSGAIQTSGVEEPGQGKVSSCDSGNTGLPCKLFDSSGAGVLAGWAVEHSLLPLTSPPPRCHCQATTEYWRMTQKA